LIAANSFGAAVVGAEVSLASLAFVVALEGGLAAGGTAAERLAFL
jgi:hypothetical protein